jgi:hypothetical protein
VASQQSEVRAAYSGALKAMNQRVQRELETSPSTDPSALALTAMIVGTLAVALTVDDDALRADLVHACRTQAQKMLNAAGELDQLNYFWGADSGLGGQRSALPVPH